MAWTSWRQSRTVSGVVAVSLAISGAMPSAWASVRSSTVRARAVEQSPNALDDIEQELQQASAMSEGAAPQAPDAAVPSTAATTPPVAAAPASPPIGGLPDWAQQAKAINLPDVHISVFAPQLADTDWGVGDPVVIDVADGTLVRPVEGIRVTIYTTVPDATPEEFRRALERARPALVARGAGHVYDALVAVAGGPTETTVAQAAPATLSVVAAAPPVATTSERELPADEGGSLQPSDQPAASYVADATQYDRTLEAATEPPAPGADVTDTGKTFIAVTVPSVPVDTIVRTLIDKRVRGVIGSAFGDPEAGQPKLVLEFGDGTPPLEQQTPDNVLRARAKAAYEFLVKAAQSRADVPVNDLSGVRVVILATDDDPALLHTDPKGRAASEDNATLHLIGSAGLFDWQGVGMAWPASPGSHYVKLALIEGARAAFPQEDDALRFLGTWARVHHNELQVSGYAATPEEEQILNDGFATIREFRRQREIARAEERAKKLAEQVQLVTYSMNLGRFYPDGRVPDDVVGIVQQELEKETARGQLTDAVVRRQQGRLFLEVTYNGPSRNPVQDYRIQTILRNAVSRDVSDERMTDAYHREFAGRSPAEQMAALHMTTGELPFNEREAEPIYVAQALGGHVSAFNLPIVQLFAREAVENQQKIEGLDDKSLARLLETNQAQLREEALREGPGYVFVIEQVKDVLAGTRNRTAYYIPTQQAPYIHVLVDDQTEWVITKVLPRAGTKLYDPNKAPLEQHPIAVVAVDQVGGSFAGEEALSPVFIGREQSGAPAVGEFTAAINRFFITPAGPNGAHHRGVVPITQEEADQGTFNNDSRVQMVAYSYQSYAKGRIPKGGIRDQVALTSDITSIRNDDKWVHEFLALHGSFQPHTTGPIARKLARDVVRSLGVRYHEIPAVVVIDPTTGQPKLTPAGKAQVKLDPFLEASNKKAVITMTTLKFDIGGDPGHQVPPDLYFATLRASLKAAYRAGLILGYDVRKVGDDMHIVIFHNKGVDNAEIHTLGWHSAFRSGWALKQINYPELKGYQPYGFMQDLVDAKVAKLIKEGKLEAFANLTDEFLQALEEEIQAFPNEATFMPNIRAAYEAFKAGKAAGTVIEMPFSGNVRGQGFGFAEKAVAADEVGQWSKIDADKEGPGAQNFKIYWSTRLMLLMRKYNEQAGGQLPLRLDAIREAMKQEFLKELAVKAPATSDAFRREFAEELFNELARRITDEDWKHAQKFLAHGAMYEAWDVKRNTRAFLDAERDDEATLLLLSAINDHNVKRMWAKKRDGWVQDLTPEELQKIEARVQAARGTLLEEIRARQAQIKTELADGKEVDQLTPWERQLNSKTDEELLPEVSDQYREILKLREFISDDYFASVSSEKLAVAGGGKYLGKDDETGWLQELMAKVGRALSKTVVQVALGNARGSHWVGRRPERRDDAVANKWSNPIETSSRYTIKADGTPHVDADGRLVSEDMYDDPSYDEARVRVVRFNERWIGVQGGFTPHGPNLVLENDEGEEEGDVEAAYPYAETARKLTRSDSPFAHPVTDTTAETFAQAQWAGQFNAIGFDPPNPAAMARRVMDRAHPLTVAIDKEAFFGHGPDGAVAVQRFLEWVQKVGNFASLDEAAKQSAVKLVVQSEPQPVQGEPDASGVKIAFWVGNEPSSATSPEWKKAHELSVEAAETLGRTSPPLVAVARNYVETNERGDIVEVGVHVRVSVLSGDHTAEILQGLLNNPDTAPLLRRAEVRKRLVNLIATVNKASQGAVSLKPEWFEVAMQTPAQADVAIGPFAWLDTMEVKTEVVLEAPTDRSKTVSAASAFYAGIEAVASGNRKLPPEVRQKLGVAGDEGLFTVQAEDIKDGEVAKHLEEYRQAVAESGVKG